MNRRDFLTTLLRGGALAAIGPSKLLAMFGKQSGKAIFVEKSSHRMYLYQTSGEKPVLEKIYIVGTGRNYGDKWHEGDGRTPEGEYEIVDKLFDQKFRPPGDGYLSELNQSMSDAYGPIAMPISYPSSEDMSKGKTGSNIWLHGTSDPSYVGRNVSNGCIIMKNQDIMDLEGRIEVGTRIVIRERIQWATP